MTRWAARNLGHDCWRRQQVLTFKASEPRSALRRQCGAHPYGAVTNPCRTGGSTGLPCEWRRYRRPKIRQPDRPNQSEARRAPLHDPSFRHRTGYPRQGIQSYPMPIRKAPRAVTISILSRSLNRGRLILVANEFADRTECADAPAMASRTRDVPVRQGKSGS